MSGRTAPIGWAWRLGLGIALAAGGALLAWWLAGVHRAWVGGMVGAVSGAFAPSLVNWFGARAEARKALRLASELPSDSPARLLDPRRRLVGFTGRQHELAALLTWCEDSRPRVVRLITGPGGVGKTRLSIELSDRLDLNQWRIVRVGDGQEASAMAAARQGRPRRLLVVVDYAETRIGLAHLLRDVAADVGPCGYCCWRAASVSGGTG